MSWLGDWRKAGRISAGFRELRAIRKVLESAVDSYRVVNGLSPIYAVLEPIEDQSNTTDRPGFVLRPGDFQLIWVIEELARENRIPITHETDLEKLALEYGWVSPDGKLLMVPKSAEGMEISGELAQWLN